jgi:hypothetical protein
MCECLHRARTSKISLKNGGSTPTFSIPFGKVRAPPISFIRSNIKNDVVTSDPFLVRKGWRHHYS